MVGPPLLPVGEKSNIPSIGNLPVIGFIAELANDFFQGGGGTSQSAS